MATRHKSGSDSKKLLTKTFSEIGSSNQSGGNHSNSAETPTPSEKVSKWHRDILLVSPPSQQNNNPPHPRQCICDQCMAEYGTYRIYNQLLDINPNQASIIKINAATTVGNEHDHILENDNEQSVEETNVAKVVPAKNDKVRKNHLFV